MDGNVTLGGTRNYDSENRKVCPHDAASIRERCVKLLPSLGKANVLSHATGLRPHRENNVRVELEKISNGSSKSTVSKSGFDMCFIEQNSLRNSKRNSPREKHDFFPGRTQLRSRWLRSVHSAGNSEIRNQACESCALIFGIKIVDELIFVLKTKN